MPTLSGGIPTLPASATSSELKSSLSDETGSGAAVFATSPALVTPDLGTPSACVATNLTGTAAGLTAGNVTTNANLAGDITSTGNTTTLVSASSLPTSDPQILGRLFTTAGAVFVSAGPP